MHRSRSSRRLLGAALLLALLSALCDVTWAGSVDIITNRDSADKPLDRATIRAIFSVRLRHWPDGVPVRVFVLPDSDPLHVKFCREQLGTFPYVLRASWDRLVYTGTGIAPEIVDDEREMRQRVTTTRGAIGYISVPDTTGSLGLTMQPFRLGAGEKE